VAWATFSGYVWALVLLIPVAIGVHFLGIGVWPGSDSLDRGVFYRADAWSFLAEACVGILITAVTALLVRSELRRQTDWEVPIGFTFVILFLTGYAPAAALTPLYGATAVVSLIVATIVLRWRAEPAGAEPMPILGAVPRRHRRGVAMAALVAAPAMVLYVLAYGVTHPIHWNGSVGFGISGTGDRQSDGRATYARDPGAIERYVFPIENLGPFEVDHIAVTGLQGSPVFQLEDAGTFGGGTSAHWPFGRGPHSPLTPLHELTLGPQSDRYLVLELRQGPICPGPVAQLDSVSLRYSVLGGTFDERMPLDGAPTIRC
jgi:hypothetical protein